jgi:hypothetical protein
MDMTQLTTNINALEAKVPEMICEIADRGNFWTEFARESGFLFDSAWPENYGFLRCRLDQMLADNLMIQDVGDDSLSSRRAMPIRTPRPRKVGPLRLVGDSQ